MQLANSIAIRYDAMFAAMQYYVHNVDKYQTLFLSICMHRDRSYRIVTAFEHSNRDKLQNIGYSCHT